MWVQGFKFEALLRALTFLTANFSCIVQNVEIRCRILVFWYILYIMWAYVSCELNSDVKQLTACRNTLRSELVKFHNVSVRNIKPFCTQNRCFLRQKLQCFGMYCHQMDPNIRVKQWGNLCDTFRSNLALIPVEDKQKKKKKKDWDRWSWEPCWTPNFYVDLCSSYAKWIQMVFFQMINSKSILYIVYYFVCTLFKQWFQYHKTMS